jgi:hypothetical protein
LVGLQEIGTDVFIGPKHKLSKRALPAPVNYSVISLKSKLEKLSSVTLPSNYITGIQTVSTKESNVEPTDIFMASFIRLTSSY